MADPTLPSARWALFGAGVISGDFARALPHARLGSLHAVASRDTARAEAFAVEHGAPVVGGYDDILTRDDIDAVYIGTVHTTHVELAAAALEAGKAVLCEKPLGVSVAETEALIGHAERTGLPLVEAFKYRFGPFPERMRQLIADGELGDVLEIETSIGFDAGDRTGRLFDPETAGGAILDAGCYPVSLAVGVAAWAGRLGAVSVVEAEGVVGTVDEQASAMLDLDGIRARVRTAITADLPRRAVIRGTRGELEVPNVWGSRTASTDTAILRRADGTSERITADVVQPMAAEADATVLALREGRTQAPEMPWFETLATARLLADWRAAL
jgi:dihydrodiol dehydrogenase / D-xylose 1-dehydrogenase (NADP)